MNNTLSHADAVAAARAGYDDVRAYYLSFADWAKDELLDRSGLSRGTFIAV